MRKFDGDIDNPLSKHKILIAAAPYYKPVVDRLIKAAKDVLFNSIQTDEIMEVSEAYCDGAFEIPRTINQHIDYFHGFVALGCIIKGETYHFELIATEVTRKIMDLSVSSKKPIGFGIITCDNMEQAIARSSGSEMKNNKGAEAASACYRALYDKTISSDFLTKTTNI